MNRFFSPLGLIVGCLVSLAMLAPARAHAEPGPLLAAQADDPYPVIPDPTFATPAGGRRVDKAAPAGGRETTLLRADGVPFAQRVDDTRGRPIVTEFFTATGELELVIFADYSGGDGSDEAALADMPASISQLHRAIGDIARPHRRSRIEGLLSHIYCGGTAWSDISAKWTQQMNWYWNSASTPGYLNQTNTLTSLRSAHAEWESNINHCGYSDFSTVNIAYRGTTTAGYGDNGINTIGWGNISTTGCGSTAIGCARVEAGFSSISEADIRLSNSATWINGKASGKFDVQYIAAHEVGHTIGFRDIDENFDCTVLMCGHVFSNDTSGRKLGQGDAIGDNTKY
jgi:hypothetical protein